jgi:N-acetylneuraminic acid mutarotase
MIVWGGTGAGDFRDGARFLPAANTWTTVPTNGAPTARFQHTAVWDGEGMIIWGGSTGLSDGGRYTPANNTWTATTLHGAPALGRVGHTAVWDGGEMIVFGGFNGFTFNDLHTYTPARTMYLYMKP